MKIIKVCGMRESRNIQEVEALGVNWIGFIFYPKSPRYVTEVPEYMPQNVRRIGVFVDATVEEIADKVIAFGLNGIQLHGHESPSFCGSLPGKIGKIMYEKTGEARPLFLIKAFSISCGSDFDAVSQYDGTCQYYLFDTKCNTVGGSGRRFDWRLLNLYTGFAPFILSGGIDEESLEDIKSLCHPRWMGIDLNSRFESAPALKDTEKLKPFIENFRKHIEL